MVGGSGDVSAVLLTGVYGAGKTTVAAEIAGMLEELGLPYGALDLDWLGWFDNGKLNDHGAGQDVMFANLSAVVGNYRQVGIRFFVLAWAVPGRPELNAIRARLGMPLRVVRLTVPLAQIEERGSAPTSRRSGEMISARRPRGSPPPEASASRI